MPMGSRARVKRANPLPSIESTPKALNHWMRRRVLTRPTWTHLPCCLAWRMRVAACGPSFHLVLPPTISSCGRSVRDVHDECAGVVRARGGRS